MRKTLEFLLKYKVFILIFLLGFWLSFAIRKEKTIEVVKTVQVAQAPIIKEKEVEKIVYKDSPETLELLDKHKNTACAFTGMYPSMFDITKAYADDWGLSSTITQDMYNLEDIAVEYLAQYCN